MTPRGTIPDLLRPSDHEYYRPTQRPISGWPERDSPHALRKSLDKAHDNLHHAIRDNDRLRAALLKVAGRQKWQLKVFIVLMGITWSGIGWILNVLIQFVMHGLAR